MPNLLDRIFSGITYFTFGIFGLIWLVFAKVTKKPISGFAVFNIVQSFFITLVFSIIGYAYSLLLRLGVMISFLGKILNSFDLFFNQTPIYLGYSISGLIVMVFISYLIIMVLIGKKPFIPFVSNIIQSITGA